MSDLLVRAMAHEGRIRVMGVNITETVREATRRHDLYPTAAAALGRLMGITSILAGQLKNDDDILIVKIIGDGPLGRIVVDATKNGHIKGYVDNPHVNIINEETKSLDVGKAVGQGQLHVTRNFGLKDDFTSSIDLVSGEIGDDFAQYFVQSEQIGSAVSVGVLVNQDGSIASAGALLIQMMPDAQEADILIAQHVVDHLKPISQILDEGMPITELVSSIFEDVQILETSEVRFHCDCSKSQMIQLLTTLPIDDLEQLREKEEDIEMVCHFCNTKYQIQANEILALIEAKQHEHQKSTLSE